MGGFGSSRWRRHERKTTVEESRVLPLKAFNRKGLLEWGIQKRGAVSWVDTGTDEVQASLSFEVETTQAVEWPRLWLVYCVPSRETPIGYPVPLETTPCNLGGERWWFRCPSLGEGRGCDGRRCGKLYRPPGSPLYLCRECHDLTYQSCQESVVSSRLARSLAANTGESANEIDQALRRSRSGARIRLQLTPLPT